MIDTYLMSSFDRGIEVDGVTDIRNSNICYDIEVFAAAKQMVDFPRSAIYCVGEMFDGYISKALCNVVW